MNKQELSSIVGKTITHITGYTGDDEVIFIFTDGSTMKMYHRQDCCEQVFLEDVVGDLPDLIGSPITLAEESTSPDAPEDYKSGYIHESETWTFYKFATIKGYVDMRWLGSSNSHYSESVDLEFTDAS